MSRGFKDRLTYKATPVQVSVPASAANLGPGFDALALALELRDIYVAQILDEEGFDVDVTGEGADEVKKACKNDGCNQPFAGDACKRLFILTDEQPVSPRVDCANIVICYFRKSGLSADDRRIAVLNTAFEPVLASFGLLRAIRGAVSAEQSVRQRKGVRSFYRQSCEECRDLCKPENLQTAKSLKNKKPRNLAGLFVV